ncbi:MAG TPA: transporter substrate-binding domain-containing protein, partial [Legionellaceae bacterium]|nr:transporter substrate-binding domain-containing protein [Legionellaceae bacterium]
MKWLKSCLGLLLSINVYAAPIVIGVDQINPPLSTRTDSASHFIGFEVDIMNEICTRMKWTCTYQSVITNQIITALESETIDFAIDTIIIPNFRLYGLILSLPYLPSNGRFMTLQDSSIKTLNDIPNKRIGVRLGAFQVNLESDMYIKHLFKVPLNIKGYLNMSDLLAALNEHEVDVIFANELGLNYWYNTNKNMYKFIGATYQIGNGYGIMSTPKHQQLMLAINEIIQNIMADGTYDMIYQRYFTNFQ